MQLKASFVAIFLFFVTLTDHARGVISDLPLIWEPTDLTHTFEITALAGDRLTMGAGDAANKKIAVGEWNDGTNYNIAGVRLIADGDDTGAEYAIDMIPPLTASVKPKAFWSDEGGRYIIWYELGGVIYLWWMDEDNGAAPLQKPIM